MNSDEIESKLAEQVINAYVKFLGRKPTESQVKNIIAWMKKNKIKVENLPETIKKSPEYLKKNIKKPIFIIGLQRGGTTILYNLLSNHPELTWISANDNSKIFSKEFLEKEKQRQEENRSKGIREGGELSMMFFAKEDTPKNPAWNMTNPNRIPVEGVHIWDHYFGRKFDAKVTSKSKQIKDLIESKCLEDKKTRFINKNPENIKRMNAINEIFPDALFVCIIRNPIPCVNSRILRVRKEGKRFYNSIPTIDADIDKMSDVEFASLNLKQNLEMIFDFSPKAGKRFYFMFYEDLLKDTKGEMGKLLDFLDLSRPKEFIKNILDLKNMNIQWKKNLTNDEVNTIVQTLSETVTKLKLPYDLKKRIT